jgi:CHAT domain-containing protein/tetratricopeptide (TPR) repeat protein
MLLAVLLAIVLGTAGPALAQSDAELDALNRRVVALLDAANFAEAMPLAKRSVELAKARRGERHPQYATALTNLAELLRATNRLSEAEPLYRRALAIDEKSLGSEHPNVARDLNNLAGLLQDTNRLAEAEPLYRRALAIDEKSYGPQHPDVARDLNGLAQLLQDTNRLAEAEPLMRRALAIDEKSLGSEHPYVAIRLNNLAALLHATNRLAEAEPLMRRALAVDEKSLGSEHPNVATDLNNLAQLLQDTNRLAEAEPLMRRALAIKEKSLGPEHPSVAISLNNLAGLLRATNRLADAEQLMRRTLAIDEKSFGPDHPNVARDLNNLAQLLRATKRLAEAEPLYRRALASDEKSFGSEHPYVATDLNNLAQLLQDTNRLAGAEPLMRRALAVDRKSLGSAHPNIARDLNNLALLRAELGDWAEAARLHQRAKPIMTGGHGKEDGSFGRATLTLNARDLRASARAVYRAYGTSTEAREEGFALAQWALQTGAADALAQMSVRFAKGAGPLAGLVRERQDLVRRQQVEDNRLLAAVGKADAKEAEAIRAAIAGLDAKVAAIDRRLGTEFPDYARLSNPKPLPVAAVQDLLREDEALVLLLDVPHFGGLPEETLAWIVTKEEARWISIPLGTAALAERVATLRCGLDREGQWEWSGRRWEAKSELCRALKPDGLDDDAPLPFDFGVAHELYAALLAPFAEVIKGKSLLIVPSGPLTSLPFHVLVMEAKGSDPRGLPPAWLALTQPITVLPSVGSLQALRELPPSQAREPYIAFGNPMLDGDQGHGERARLARARQRCPQDIESLRRRAAASNRGPTGVGDIFRGGINLAILRAQAPLPETADELCAVASSLGAPGHEAEPVWLGSRATETNLKALSRSGALARYRVLHFATHGVLAGESETILKAKAEPALILTPPKDGATREQLEEDDGLLAASEVAQLELDADWVVLSACNTAAGEKGDAEALSGLARAFFYAKARALLVSHWYVNSEAAVKITTGAFAALRADPKIGRAEALRRSMARLITAGRPDEVHPEYWAPFVLVGQDR